MRFLEELKRRRVVRALSIYLAGAWVVAQVVGEVLIPALGLDERAVRWVVIATLIGLPVVAVLAWVVDLDWTGEAPAGESTGTHWFGWRAAAAVVALLLTGGAVGWLAGSNRTPVGDDGQALAVLPFESLTGAEDQYLSDGLTEDVSVALQKAGAFEVVGRLSTERYRADPRPAMEIAEELGVRYLLSGSVRRSSDQIRVTVQLSDGRSNRSVWTEQYDRRLTVDDLFSLYSDVAENLARSLQADLAPQGLGRLAERPTDEFAAYDLYLRGRSAWRRRLPELMPVAIDYFDRATSMDPEYARAYAGKADAMLLQGFYLPGAEGRAALEDAKTEARRALSLEPELAEAHTSLGYALWLSDWDWDGAEAALRRALELSPGAGNAHHWLGDLLAQRLRTEEALTHLDIALALDPFAPAYHFDRAKALFWVERYAESLENFEAAIRIEPEYIGVTYGLHAEALRGLGREDEALEVYAAGVAATEGAATAARIRTAYQEGGWLRVDTEELAQMEAAGDPDPYFRAALLASVGRMEEALATLGTAVDERSFFAVTLYAAPGFRTVLGGYPGYSELVTRIGLDPSGLPDQP